MPKSKSKTQLPDWLDANQARLDRTRQAMLNLMMVVAHLPTSQQSMILKAAQQIADEAYRAGADEVQFGHGW